MPGFKHRSKRIPFMILFVLGLAAILSYLVMWLWNEILVPVTGVNIVDFWQAAGLLLLSRILFGGFKGGPWKRGPGRPGFGHRGGPSDWQEKWQNMSEEEREQMKNRWREKFEK